MAAVITVAFYYAKLCDMRYLIETDFDKAYDELSAINQDILIIWPNKDELIANGAETPWQPLGIFDNNDKGIYVIKNNTNNALYIGKAVGYRGFRARQQAHFRGDENDSPYLHNVIRDIRKNSTNPDEAVNDTFSWCRLMTLNDADINSIRNYEVAAIACYKTCKPIFGGNDYNLTFGGDGGSHPKYSNEQISQVLSLLPNTELTMEDIAIETGVGYDTVRLINKTNNIRPKELTTKTIRDAAAEVNRKAVLVYKDSEYMGEFPSLKSAAEFINNDGGFNNLNSVYSNLKKITHSYNKYHIVYK